jgi:hypothetical protein
MSEITVKYLPSSWSEETTLTFNQNDGLNSPEGILQAFQTNFGTYF